MQRWRQNQRKTGFLQIEIPPSVTKASNNSCDLFTFNGHWAKVSFASKDVCKSQEKPTKDRYHCKKENSLQSYPSSQIQFTYHPSHSYVDVHKENHWELRIPFQQAHQCISMKNWWDGITFMYHRCQDAHNLQYLKEHWEWIFCVHDSGFTQFDSRISRIG